MLNVSDADPGNGVPLSIEFTFLKVQFKHLMAILTILGDTRRNGGNCSEGRIKSGRLYILRIIPKSFAPKSASDTRHGLVFLPNSPELQNKNFHLFPKPPSFPVPAHRLHASASLSLAVIRCQLEALGPTVYQWSQNHSSARRTTIRRLGAFPGSKATVTITLGALFTASSLPHAVETPLAGRRYVVSARSWLTVHPLVSKTTSEYPAHRKSICRLESYLTVPHPTPHNSNSPTLHYASSSLAGSRSVVFGRNNLNSPTLHYASSSLAGSRSVVFGAFTGLAFSPGALPPALTTGRRYVASGHFQPFSKTRFSGPQSMDISQFGATLEARISKLRADTGNGIGTVASHKHGSPLTRSAIDVFILLTELTEPSEHTARMTNVNA
ncbi:hypothetical protein DFP72DRAFT_843144 [Ephemerocybe angulata]|uniref:Uncharacterized protein n=1 Tax=Ephemerocybe angulata TaxID=980116 RepID=A0A8H6I959_9AGAR|nr:hypothetical protein DFP72DRAFT_843141 [Tulosesus angulatus]KAF6760869.1 hypothetical protein DFP72DRAFT_843144 [Tulosesus angulatus]